MKNLKQLYRTASILLFILIILSCSKEEILTTSIQDDVIKDDLETVSTNTQDINSKISSTSWNVQTKGKTYSFTTDVPNRYDYSSTELWMKVVDGDATTPNSTHPRTELRSNSANFSTKSAHKMTVTMKIIKSTSKVVIGQLFSESIGSDYGAIFLRNSKLYAQFDGNDEILLNDSIGSTITIWIETKVVNNSDGTQSGYTTMYGGGRSISKRKTIGECYFKTGVYLIDGGSAEIEISSLSKY